MAQVGSQLSHCSAFPQVAPMCSTSPAHATAPCSTLLDLASLAEPGVGCDAAPQLIVDVFDLPNYETPSGGKVSFLVVK